MIVLSAALASAPGSYAALLRGGGVDPFASESVFVGDLDPEPEAAEVGGSKECWRLSWLSSVVCNVSLERGQRMQSV